MRPPPKRLVPVCVAVLLFSQFDAAFACNTKSKMYVTATKSDLRNLVTVEDDFYALFGHYTASLDSLSHHFFKSSTGVNPPTIQLIDGGGWRAQATHAELRNLLCTIAIGSGTRTGEIEGRPQCVDTDSSTVHKAVSSADTPAVIAIIVTALVGVMALLVQRTPIKTLLGTMVLSFAWASTTPACAWGLQAFVGSALGLVFFGSLVGLVVVGLVRGIRLAHRALSAA